MCRPFTANKRGGESRPFPYQHGENQMQTHWTWLTRTGDRTYPVAVNIIRVEPGQTVVVTYGIFRKLKSARVWGEAVRKLFNELPEAQAQNREPPDDWEKDRMQ